MVNMENYEEYMLLYADNELSAEEEQLLLTFVAAHPQLQGELDAYMSTRIVPEQEIIYTNKETLIKSAPRGRSIWLGNFKTYAAAASILAVIVIFAAMYKSGKNIEPPLAIADTESAPVTHTPLVTEPVPPTTPETITPPETPKKTEYVARKTVQPKKSAPAIETPVKKKLPGTAAPVTEHIAKQETVTLPAEEYVAKEGKINTQETIETPEETSLTEQQHKKNRLIAAVIGDRTEGLEQLELALNEKLEQAKTIKEEIDNTEIKLRLGKKELFTVRL